MLADDDSDDNNDRIGVVDASCWMSSTSPCWVLRGIVLTAMFLAEFWNTIQRVLWVGLGRCGP
jgi:hypothetical protein